MGRRFILFALLLPLLAPILGGCGNTPPYIFKDDEFDREDPDFAKEPKDRSSVYICYSKRGTTPADVRKMAEAECARYDKVAVFESQDILYCPLMTPARAKFACVPKQPAPQYPFPK